MAEIALIIAPALALEDELLTIACAAWRVLDLDTTMDPDAVESPLAENGWGAAGGRSWHRSITSVISGSAFAFKDVGTNNLFFDVTLSFAVCRRR